MKNELFDIAENVRGYYDSDNEADRFAPLWKQIELVNTKRLLDDFICEGDSVLDCAAGSGLYTAYLHSRGAKMSVSDLSKRNVKSIKDLLAACHIEDIPVRVADARDLSAYPSSSFDAVLCMGPLYHLAPKDWPSCANECFRVTKPGGVVVYSYMPRLFTAIELLNNTRYKISFDDADYLLQNGVLPPGRDGFYGCAYFSTPQEVVEFFSDASCKIVSHVSVDLDIPHRYQDMQNIDEVALARFSKLAYQYGSDPGVLSCSKHNVIVVKRLKR